MKRIVLGAALFLVPLTLPAQADLLVHKAGSVIEGKALPGDPTADLLFQPALPADAPPRRIPRPDIARLILTDEQGARLTDAAPEKWDIPPDPAAPPIAAARKGNTYCLIPLHGEVGETVLASALEASLADALQRRPAVVVLDIDSPGGRIFEAEALVKVLHKYNSKLRIVALADKDFSAAAITTLAVHEIYLKPTGVIGAARAFQSAHGGMPEDIAEKMQSAWRAVARNSAEEGGHNPLLADAMIDASHSLYIDHDASGKPVVREGMGNNQIVNAGKILTLTSRETIACGLAAGIAEDLPDLGKQLKMAGWTPMDCLGALLADQLPKKQAAYDRQMKQIETAAEIHFTSAQRSDPAAGTSEKSLFPQDDTPDSPGTRRLMVVPRPVIVPHPIIPRPALPVMPPVPPGLRQPMRPSISHDNDDIIQQRMWAPKSLQCVVSLQDVEQDLKRGIALSQAFGRAGDAADLQTALDKVSELRQHLYDDRNRFASVTWVPTAGGLVRSDALPDPPSAAAPTAPTAPFHPAALPPGMPIPPAIQPAPVIPRTPLTPPSAASALPAARSGAPAMRVTTIDQAQAALASGDARNITTAARFLTTAAVTPENQPEVLKALAPLLDRPAEKSACVAAYVRWARKEDMPTLVAALQHPSDPPNDIRDAQCWAAAFPTLVHFVPQDAESAILQHKQAFFFKSGVTRQLEKMILDDSPDAATARRLRTLLAG